MITNECGDSPWSDTINIALVNTLGISELEQALNMQLYPNPNDGNFAIEFNTVKEMNVNIGVYNQAGASIYRIESLKLNGLKKQEFNLGHLSAGSYTVVIETEDGKLSRQLLIQE